MENDKNNVFEYLNSINVSDQLKEKIGLKYLSWAYAWNILRVNYPDATYKVYTREVQLTESVTADDKSFDTSKQTTVTSTSEVPYFTDGKTCFVKVGVTVNGREEIELLPVMDNKNNAVPLAAVTMTQVNKAIQRAFVKACARHGLGLYVYAGEDLPEVERKGFSVINYDEIKANALAYDNKSGMLKEEFDTKIKDIIDCLSNNKFPEDVLNHITTFIMEQTNKRISTLDFNVPEDALATIHIWNYINGVKDAVNGTK